MPDFHKQEETRVDQPSGTQVHRSVEVHSTPERREVTMESGAAWPWIALVVVVLLGGLIGAFVLTTNQSPSVATPVTTSTVREVTNVEHTTQVPGPTQTTVVPVPQQVTVDRPVPGPTETKMVPVIQQTTVERIVPGPTKTVAVPADDPPAPVEPSPIPEP